MGKRRIGVYGGTFDPIHCGHIEIARAVIDRFQLDTLLFVPAYKPPHKRLDAIAEAHHRYEMVKRAIADAPHLAISRLELDAPERPYTVQTMARLRAEYGLHSNLFFVMGADSFQDIRKWREWETLIAGTNLIVVTRPCHTVSPDHLPADVRARVIDLRDAKDAARLIQEGEGCFIYLVDDVYMDISSTDIRRKVRNGESLEGLVPPRVIDYIETHHLYRQEL